MANALFYFDYTEATDQYFWRNRSKMGSAIQNTVNLEEFDKTFGRELIF